MRSIVFALSLVSVLAISSRAVSQDGTIVCVACTDPTATYRCEVLPPDTGVMAQSPQIFCAAEVARNNGHSTCIVQRNVAAAQCQGQALVLAYTGPINDAEDLEQPAAVEQPQGSQQPKTLVEATDQVVKSTGKQLKKAGKSISKAGQKVGDVTKKTGEQIKETGQAVGDTVSDAAKSTWKCLASLFQSC